MTNDILATVLTGAAVLVGVWRMVEGVRRDLTNQIAAVNTRIDTAVGSLNTRIDNILLRGVDQKAP